MTTGWGATRPLQWWHDTVAGTVDVIGTLVSHP